MVLRVAIHVDQISSHSRNWPADRTRSDPTALALCLQKTQKHRHRLNFRLVSLKSDPSEIPNRFYDPAVVLRTFLAPHRKEVSRNRRIYWVSSLTPSRCHRRSRSNAIESQTRKHFKTLEVAKKVKS